MEDILAIIIVIPTIFVGLPWLILHYITKWKTGATLTADDEVMLQDLHTLARKLEERMETVERIVAADNPDFEPRRSTANDDMPADPSTDPIAFSRGAEQ
ncbi:MAG: envelope stress response membrane protein PspB [Novosphingobium sp.]|nr:envelope stress response membrane protein PspB [Novosphingobium sp.]